MWLLCTPGRVIRVTPYSALLLRKSSLMLEPRTDTEYRRSMHHLHCIGLFLKLLPNSSMTNMRTLQLSSRIQQQLCSLETKNSIPKREAFWLPLDIQDCCLASSGQSPLSTLCSVRGIFSWKQITTILSPCMSPKWRQLQLQSAFIML